MPWKKVVGVQRCRRQRAERAAPRDAASVPMTSRHVTAAEVTDRVAPWRPRLLDRVHNVLHTPDVIQKQRELKWIADDTRGKPASWFFQGVPEDRLTMFMTDIDSLVRSSG